MYFNYTDYLKNRERGQFPFIPAVGVLLQLNEKLQRAEYFIGKIKNLPLRVIINNNCTSNCVTALGPTKQGVNTYKIFEIIKDEYGIWICPNAGELSAKVFRVGYIGSIRKEEIDKLIEIFLKIQ